MGIQKLYNNWLAFMDKYIIKGKWLDDLNEDLQGSDRSCAVLAGAIMDDLLKTLLQRYLLVPANKKDDKLLGHSGPIDSFSARIELARRLNLISEHTRKALDWVRDIRNQAAHQTDFRFDSDSNKDKVANIVSSLKPYTQVDELLKKPYEGVKGNFVAMTILMAVGLNIEIGEIGMTTFRPVDAIAFSTISNKS